MAALILKGQILEAGGSVRRLARLLQLGTAAGRSISNGLWQPFVRLTQIVYRQLSTSLILTRSHQSRSRNNVLLAILYASTHMYVIVLYVLDTV